MLNEKTQSQNTVSCIIQFVYSTKFYWCNVDNQKYIFKVYNLMTQYTYTLWNIQHNQVNQYIYHIIVIIFLRVCVCMCVCWEHPISTLLANIKCLINIFNYSHIAIHQFSRTYSVCIIETSYPLTNIFPFPHPPTTGIHNATLSFYELEYFRVHMRLYIISLTAIGLLHLACLLG